MVRLRPAVPDDYDTFARLFPALEVDDPVPSREVWATELVPTAFMAEVDGATVAYVWFQLFASEGIVRHLVVDASQRGKRVGERLLLAAAEVMRAKGLTRWALNVKPENVSALKLYHRVGMELFYESQALRFGWELVDRLPVGEGTFFVEEVLREDERAVELQQNLPDGTLATQRALPGRVIRAVVEDDFYVGAAVFVPTFPGAYPFRANSPAAARALLEALKPHALPAPPYMQVVTEGQPELAAALRGAGATVRLDILHLAGPLPPATSAA